MLVGILFGMPGVVLAASPVGTVVGLGATVVPFPITNATAISIRTGISGNALVLRSDGTVVSWGLQRWGFPETPAGISNIVAVAAGAAHSVVLKADGKVMCWGRDIYGETRVPEGLGHVTAISAGFTHTLALLADGTVQGWGDLLPPSGLTEVVAISSGVDHALALRRDGTVIGWGSVNQWGQADVPPGLNGVASISAGRMHSLALKTGGTVVGWGNTFFAPVPAGLSNVTAIAAGGFGNLALRSDRRVVSWPNDDGGLKVWDSYTNLLAIATGDDATLLLTQQPLILEAPISISRLAGDRGEFQVAALGHEAVTYQWLKGSQPIPGATRSTLILENVQAGDIGEYQVVVSTSGGSVTSQVAGLSVTPRAPSLLQSPTSLDVRSGDGVSLKVQAAGTEPMTYQWFRSGTELTGETNAVLQIASASVGDTGTYRVRIRNALDTVYTEEARLGVHPPPIVLNEWVPLSLRAGGSQILSAQVQGEAPIQFQWQHQGVDIPGAVHSSLPLRGIQNDAEGDYSVVVRNEYWVLTNRLYSVTVEASRPIITQGPASQRFLPGGTAALRVRFEGNAPMSFQWWHGDRMIPAATNATLMLTNLQPSDAGAYRVSLSNPLGSTNSVPAVLSEGDPYPGQFDAPVLQFTGFVTNRFRSPVGIVNAGDGSGRLFIVEQAGRIQIVVDGKVLTEPFLDITSRVQSGVELGLLGLAFPPGFLDHPWFYVAFTRRPDRATVVARYRVDASNRNRAVPASEEIVLAIPQPFSNHKGGQLAFGPDGYLYIGVGDGGSNGTADPNNNGQNTASLLGKILRIGVEDGVRPYSIPESNPFFGTVNHAPEIWALGLRNPWRFSFDRLTGDLFIGDVGERRFEEINFQPATSKGGENYGWRVREGPAEFIVPPGLPAETVFTDPVAWYGRAEGGSVIGGYVYRGPSEPRMNGLYFYSDYLTARYWALRHGNPGWQSAQVALGTVTNSTFGEGENGELYVAEYLGGRILRLQDSRQVSPPTLTPRGGIINSNTVTVVCTTPGAGLHFTTDGREPTEDDPVIPSGGSLTVTSDTILQVRGFRDDLNPSAITLGRFTVKVANPLVTPAFGPIPRGTQVTLVSSTPESIIRYSLDGSVPDSTAPPYVGPILVDGGTTLNARAFRTGFDPSDVVTVYYDLALAAMPEFHATQEPVTNGTPVSISCATPDAKIHYTLDGSDPNAQSPLYTGPLPIQGDTWVKAIALHDRYGSSGIAAHFFERVKVATPEFSPPAGPITNQTVVTIASHTPGAEIRYTLDGSIPDRSSPLYTGPLTLSGNITLSAVGRKEGYNDSAVQVVRFNRIVRESTVVWTLAGTGQPGTTAGFRTAAAFNAPEGVWFNGATGELFVADTGNHKIRKILPSGDVVDVAGTGEAGFVEGPASQAQFNGPTSICGDGQGTLYVADRNNSHRIRKISSDGIVSTYATVREPHLLPGITQIDMDAEGRLFVGNWALVTMVTGYEVGHTIAGSQSAGSFEGWSPPIGIAVAPTGVVYASTLKRIVKIIPDVQVEDFSGGPEGFSDGPRLEALYEGPLDIAAAKDGTLFVSDWSRVRRIGTNDTVTTLAGSGTLGFRNGPGGRARFNVANGLSEGPHGDVFVADTYNHCIRVISTDSDSDGIPDFEEGGSTPFVVGVDDQTVDTDLDGMTNTAEFLARTNPRDRASRLQITGSEQVNGGRVEIRWQTQRGVSYVIESTADMVQWNPVGAKVAGNGEAVTFTTDPTDSEGPARLFRVAVADLD